MKAWLQRQLERLLGALARQVVQKYNPDIIGITGSVGKTSTKHAIACVLGQRFAIRSASGSYNNELGVPLAIIGGTVHGANPFGWAREILRAFGLLLRRQDYPRILVLEMGAQKSGDIDYLLGIAPARIGVLTAITPVHLEFFKTIEALTQEKATIIKALPEDGFGVLNGDDERIRTIIVPADVTVTTYGLKAGNEVRATNVQIKIERVPQPDGIIREAVLGTAFVINHQGLKQLALLKDVIGPQHVLAALAATAVGLAYGLTLSDIAARLAHYRGLPGRMRLLAGKYRSWIIDDSYNSSPEAAIAALAALKSFPRARRRIAVLGFMAELGDYTHQGHERVGAHAAQTADLVVAVGPTAATYAEAAKRAKMKTEAMQMFADVQAAAEFLAQTVEPGDVVLIKGSQVSRMEKVVKALMAEPLRAGELLVRQSEEWLKKP